MQTLLKSGFFSIVSLCKSHCVWNVLYKCILIICFKLTLVQHWCNMHGSCCTWSQIKSTERKKTKGGLYTNILQQLRQTQKDSKLQDPQKIEPSSWKHSKYWGPANTSICVRAESFLANTNTNYYQRKNKQNKKHRYSNVLVKMYLFYYFIIFTDLSNMFPTLCLSCSQTAFVFSHWAFTKRGNNKLNLLLFLLLFHHLLKLFPFSSLMIHNTLQLQTNTFTSRVTECLKRSFSHWVSLVFIPTDQQHHLYYSWT